MVLVERGSKDLTGVLGKLVMDSVKVMWNARDFSL